MTQKDLDRLERLELLVLEGVDELAEAYTKMQQNLREKDEALAKTEGEFDKKKGLSPKQTALFEQQIGIELMRIKAFEEIAMRALDKTGASCSADAIGG